MKGLGSRLLALPGFVEVLLALAVLWLHHGLLSSTVSGWAEFLYPLGASWGYRDWSGLTAVFTPDYWTAFRYGKGDWVPASFLFFFLDRRLAGPTPAAVNAGALLLLVLDSWLAAAVGRRLTGKPLAGLVSGLVFGLHPLFWDASMTMLTSHLLMSLSLMAAFWSYLRGREPGTRSRLWASASCAGYLLAMLSKPPGVVFPALILLYELSWADAGLPWQSRLKRGLKALPPYLVMAAAFLIAFRWVHPGLQGVTSAGFSKGWTVLDPLQRLQAVAAGLTGQRHGPWVWGAGAALLAAAALSGRFLFFLGWSIITLSPYLNLIPLEGLSRAMAFKDFQPRYALLACAALGWAASAGLMKGLERGGWTRRGVQALLCLLALAAAVRVSRPLTFALPAAPLTRFLSLPFVRAADPAAYKSMLAESAARHGTAAAELFAELSGSGLLYEDPDAAGWVRHIVYDLEFRPIFEPELPRAFLDRLRPMPEAQKHWLAAQSLIAEGKPERALPRLERVLDADPNHSQALLAASGVLAGQGRSAMARALYAAARTETGLRHGPLLAAACGRMPAVCAKLDLKDASYEDAMRDAMDMDLDGPGSELAGLKAADRDLAFSYGRAMAANGHYPAAARAYTAALPFSGRRRADILLERAAARLRCQDQAGAAQDLEDIRPSAVPAWAGYRRWQALRDSAQP